MPGSAEEPSAPPSALPARPPRERMIRAAEYLIRTKVSPARASAK